MYLLNSSKRVLKYEKQFQNAWPSPPSCTRYKPRRRRSTTAWTRCTAARTGTTPIRPKCWPGPARTERSRRLSTPAVRWSATRVSFGFCVCNCLGEYALGNNKNSLSIYMLYCTGSKKSLYLVKKIFLKVVL